jgi:D-alanine-D-alanine ligase
MSRHVAVLMGGWSAEREVSLVSGAAVSNALREVGHEVTSIDVQRDMGTLMTRLFPRPDAVFNALHGRYGEDGCVQGLLNILQVPYTHSGMLASALAMDKPMAKRLFEAAGIAVAEHVIASKADVAAGDVMDRPYVVKPINEGSSVRTATISPPSPTPAGVTASTSWSNGSFPARN